MSFLGLRRGSAIFHSEPLPVAMEWRVFVPCRVYGDMMAPHPSLPVTALPTHALSLTQAEATLADIVQTIYSLRPNADREERTDNYVIGNKHFGLKLRDGSKWELKTLVQRTDLGVEQYSKVKYGKKSLKKYEDEILEQLHLHGHTDDATYRRILSDAPLSQLEVRKSRTNAFVGNVCVEVAELELVSPCGVPKHWCSLALESDNPMDIQSFLASNVLIRRILQGVNAFHHQASTLTEQPPVAYPILGGYPAWVEFASMGCPRDTSHASFEPTLCKLFT